MPGVGSLIEEPKFFRPFSGRRNLQLLAEVADLPAYRVGEVLETVGLADRADEGVKGYSLGMRQRLGIAAALLKSPEPADPRRAVQRARPGRHPRDPHPPTHSRRRRRHDPRVVAPAGRGAAGLRRGDNHLARSRGTQRTGSRGTRDGGCNSPAAGGPRRSSRTVVASRSSKQQAFWFAATAPSCWSRERADPADVTRLLADQGLYLSQLQAETADLEDVFLSLTEVPA